MVNRLQFSHFTLNKVRIFLSMLYDYAISIIMKTNLENHKLTIVFYQSALSALWLDFEKVTDELIVGEG